MASISSLGVGSGLDLNGLLDQLQEAEQEKLVPIQQQQVEQKTQISAYGQLQSSLSEVQSSASDLNDPELFNSVTSNVEGESAEAAATPDAPPGRYDVNVQQLATASSIATQGVDEETVLNADTEASLDVTLNDGTAQNIKVEADSTLSDVRDAINASDAGVSASVVFDGSQSRLAIASESTGAEAGIDSVAFNGLDGLALDTATEIQGQDAQLDVNGVAITSDSNQVEEAIQGTTLSLTDTGESTVTVARDDESIRGAITGFVDSYNDMKSTTADLTSFSSEDGETQAGDLLGDSTTRMAESRLRSTMTESVGEGGLQTLEDVGISMNVDGELEVDDEQLDEALSTQPGAVQTLFSGTDESAGIAGRVEEELDTMLGENGMVEGAVTGAENQMDRLEERYSSMEDSIATTVDRYRTQFQELDSMVSEMNQTSDYLTQQLSAM
ncbi:flagellar filament capping protein FliD [Chromohalobacter canadensis]|uniref:flagellar filament capping protein FliD n=1 Tax=Chromohalobacter canadensis TaxID=141389 RepID=UPI0021BEB4DF|nr:flagellar filament capping protein FliD [Chromohalobacter canadensis]MCT8466961.1 flagellar filament capping protein FliD [Chromohalobacter canadensis]MCT8471241.1 flagellar filament capping protein FliD [Chromohalobacter canadensis]MCT8497508.1 flagellar filament capping protein FliD [Chromohalobacter canadensis]